MLEKRDYRVIPGATAEEVWAKAWDWWQRAGFALYHVGPGHFTGSSVYSKIGLRREIDLRFMDANNALYVDLAFRARLPDEGAVAAVGAAVHGHAAGACACRQDVREVRRRSGGGLESLPRVRQPRCLIGGSLVPEEPLVPFVIPDPVNPHAISMP